jgi:choline kinase
MTPTMIILAAGEGTRLRPLTDDKPKCLVELAGESLLSWQMASAARLGLTRVAVVTGYRADKFNADGAQWYHNADYAETNMVETLWCAEQEFGNQMIVAYGDIVYEDSVLQALLDDDAPISVVVDLEWLQYWKLRFDDPLSDAETLRIDSEGMIKDIGQKPSSIDEIQGQYIGLMKFQGPGIDALKSTYEGLKKAGSIKNSNRPFKKMYMTDLLQAVVESGAPVHSVLIQRGWLEIDSTSDHELANDNASGSPDGLFILV